MAVNITTLLYTICILFITCSIMYYKKQKHPIRTALIGFGSGVVCLFAAHFVFGLLQISVAVNYFTLLAAAAFGIPGVAAMVTFSIFL